MKKLLKFLRSFILLVVIHFAISLLSNWVFDQNEIIGETIITSLLFATIYVILVHFISKAKKESERT